MLHTLIHPGISCHTLYVLPVILGNSHQRLDSLALCRVSGGTESAAISLWVIHLIELPRLSSSYLPPSQHVHSGSSKVRSPAVSSIQITNRPAAMTLRLGRWQSSCYDNEPVTFGPLLRVPILFLLHYHSFPRPPNTRTHILSSENV